MLGVQILARTVQCRLRQLSSGHDETSRWRESPCRLTILLGVGRIRAEAGDELRIGSVAFVEAQYASESFQFQPRQFAGCVISPCREHCELHSPVQQTGTVAPARLIQSLGISQAPTIFLSFGRL